ncbi:hypothetical protein D3C87_612730 [compost metagenome]
MILCINLDLQRAVGITKPIILEMEDLEMMLLEPKLTTEVDIIMQTLTLDMKFPPVIFEHQECKCIFGITASLLSKDYSTQILPWQLEHQ